MINETRTVNMGGFLKSPGVSLLPGLTPQIVLYVLVVKKLNAKLIYELEPMC